MFSLIFVCILICFWFYLFWTSKAWIWKHIIETNISMGTLSGKYLYGLSLSTCMENGVPVLPLSTCIKFSCLDSQQAVRFTCLDSTEVKSENKISLLSSVWRHIRTEGGMAFYKPLPLTFYRKLRFTLNFTGIYNY